MANKISGKSNVDKALPTLSFLKAFTPNGIHNPKITLSGKDKTKPAVLLSNGKSKNKKATNKTASTINNNANKIT